jgi:hypothetical protein
MMEDDADTLQSPAVLSGLRTVALGVAGIITLGVVLGTYDWLAQRPAADPITPPACYGADEANYTPHNQPIPLRGAPGRGGPSIDQRRDKQYLERIEDAESTCGVNVCTRQAFDNYRSALFWYLSLRTQHTRQLDREYGQLGLRRAADIYSEPEDARIENGLRERYRRGVFRIADFRQNRDAVAILVLKGGTALRPCRRADIAVK